MSMWKCVGTISLFLQGFLPGTDGGRQRLTHCFTLKDLTIRAHSSVHTAGGAVSLHPRVHHTWPPSPSALPEVIHGLLSSLEHGRLHGLAQTDRQTERQTYKVLEP